jgi:hypothetical protein
MAGLTRSVTRTRFDSEELRADVVAREESGRMIFT